MEEEAVVTFTFGVWLADTECTQAFYRAVVGSNPSVQVGDDLPVTHVTIGEAVAFTRMVSKQLQGAKARLPSRAEWERGCRAGTRTLYATGDDPASLAGYANLFDVDRAKATNGKPKFSFADGFVDLAPVAHFKPNPWGLYDMHGNVCEYSLGVFGALRGEPRDPMISEDGTQNGFIKGGSYASEDTIKARSGALPYIGTNSHNPDIGLRFLIESR
jgi:formylglycine-generating enzyme required for sulfatase activity